MPGIFRHPPRATQRGASILAFLDDGSMTGTALIDFGTFPGKADTTIVVTGQAAILAGSLVEAWIRPIATADHSADEHMVEDLKVFAADIVAGTGFTIHGVTDERYGESHLRYGQWTIAWAWV